MRIEKQYQIKVGTIFEKHGVVLEVTKELSGWCWECVEKNEEGEVIDKNYLNFYDIKNCKCR